MTIRGEVCLSHHGNTALQDCVPSAYGALEALPQDRSRNPVAMHRWRMAVFRAVPLRKGARRRLALTLTIAAGRRQLLTDAGTPPQASCACIVARVAYRRVASPNRWLSSTCAHDTSLPRRGETQQERSRRAVHARKTNCSAQQVDHVFQVDSFFVERGEPQVVQGPCDVQGFCDL